MRKVIMPAAILVAVLGLGLAGCQKAPSTPGEKIQQGAQEMGRGLAQAGDQARQVASDTAVTTKVKAALVATKGLSSMDIHVTTNNGVVTLSGTVDTNAQKDLAASVTVQVDGVQGVTDQLVVKAGS